MRSIKFALESNWVVDADIGVVWSALRAVDEWPAWWPYVESVRELRQGDDDGIGAVHRITWTSRLPYSIAFDVKVVEVAKPCRMVGEARGDLDGRGIWTLEADARQTRVRYEWRVEVAKPWMIALAPLLRPLFAWNHNQVMAAGETGLRRHLNGESARP